MSRICQGLDERVAAFRGRTLGHVAFPYVYLDATYVNVRDDALGQVVSRAVVVATGITANGDREVLGLDIGDSEDETFWTRFLRSLRDRGLAGVRLVISDAHAGLKASIRKCFSGASWQRCRVHYARNLLAVIPKAQQEFVAAAFRSIFAHTTAAEVEARYDEVAAMLAERFPKAAASLTDARVDVLAFSAFPVEHWRKIWSNNPLERLNKEIKRRSNVVGIFLRVPLAPASTPSGVGAARLPEGPRVTRNLSVEPSALTLLGPVLSVPRGWPRDLIAA